MALDDVRIIRIHGEASTKAKKPQNRQYDYDGAYNPNDLIHGSLLCQSDRKRLKRLKVPSRGILASIARLTAGLCLLGLDYGEFARALRAQVCKTTDELTEG
jgi:hypothetical protein